LSTPSADPDKPMQVTQMTTDSKDAFTGPYREAIGGLMHLALCTRPDICHAVISLSRYSSAPLQRHWTGVKRVFRYLVGTVFRHIPQDGHPSSRGVFVFHDVLTFLPNLLPQWQLSVFLGFLYLKTNSGHSLRLPILDNGLPVTFPPSHPPRHTSCLT
jgi:hypothetical protein